MYATAADGHDGGGVGGGIGRLRRGTAEETDPISIGIIADLTGPFTTYGTSLDRSARRENDEVNEDGSIDWRQVEVITEDIQTDVAATVDKARNSWRATRWTW